MNRFTASCLATCLVAVAYAQTPPVVKTVEARQYVGKVVVVEDAVAEVRWEEQSAVTYLNFGAAFPHHVFRVLVPDDVRQRLPSATFSSPRVRVQGTVRLGPRDIPEILCADVNQLSALAAVPPAAGIAALPGTPPPASAPKPCCRICTTGKACGNSCIARSATCRQPPGCACNG